MSRACFLPVFFSVFVRSLSFCFSFRASFHLYPFPRAHVPTSPDYSLVGRAGPLRPPRAPVVPFSPPVSRLGFFVPVFHPPSPFCPLRPPPAFFFCDKFPLLSTFAFWVMSFTVHFFPTLRVRTVPSLRPLQKNHVLAPPCYFRSFLILVFPFVPFKPPNLHLSPNRDIVPSTCDGPFPSLLVHSRCFFV